MTTQLEVASNLMNSLIPWRRLPLLESESDALSFKGPGLFRVYVPSRYGGVLRVGCDQPTAKIVVRHPKPGSPPLKDLADKTIPAAQTFTYPVRDGEFLWFHVLVGCVKGDYRVWATFDEIGLARESQDLDADPLIPWNFWYFPNASSRKEVSAWGSSTLQPCQKYERAFGKSGVLAWEKQHHNDPKGNAGPWWGHCHNGAPASIIFENPPPAGVKHGGETFLCEELKFFATEFFGRFGRLDYVWGLPGTGSMRRQGFYQENKPSDDPARFGKLVGEFHELLRDNLQKKMAPVMMDLRDSAGADHSAVWNQAIYKYVARMWEATPHGDWKDIQVRTMLHANDDTLRQDRRSSGLPAKIEANGPRAGGKPKDAVSDPSTAQRDEMLLYRLQFRDDGTISTKDKKNEWMSAASANGATQLHAPRFSFRPTKVGSSPGADADGNPLIERGDVLQLLKLRDRYK